MRVGAAALCLGLAVLGSSVAAPLASARTYAPAPPTGTSWVDNPDGTHTFWLDPPSGGTKIKGYTYDTPNYNRILIRERGLALELGATEQTVGVHAGQLTLPGMDEADGNWVRRIAARWRARGTTAQRVAGKMGWPGSPVTSDPAPAERSFMRLTNSLRRFQVRAGVMPSFGAAMTAIGRVSMAATAFTVGLSIGTKIDELFGWPSFNGAGHVGYCTTGSPCTGFITPATGGDVIPGWTAHTWPSGTVQAWGWSSPTLGGADIFQTFKTGDGSGCESDPAAPAEFTELGFGSTTGQRCTFAVPAHVYVRGAEDIATSIPQELTGCGASVCRSMAAPSAVTGTALSAVATPDGGTDQDLIMAVMGGSFASPGLQPGEKVAPLQESGDTPDPAVGAPLTETPTDPSLLTIPAIEIGTDTYSSYLAKLTALGLVGSLVLLTDTTSDPAVGPDKVSATVPAAGLQVAVGDTVQVRVNPSTAPDPDAVVGGGGGCTPWVSPNLNLSPLNVGLLDKFPFAVPGFIADVFGDWVDYPGTAPSIHMPFPETADGVTIDFSIWDDSMPVWRIMALFSSFIGLAWFFGGILLGWGGGAASED